MLSRKRIKEDIKEEMKEFEDEDLGVLDLDEEKAKVKKVKNGFLLKGLVLAEFIFIVLLLVWNFLLFLIPKKTIGYVVEVNQLTGTQNVRNIENAVVELEKYTMPEYLMINAVKSYITNLRQVSTDIYICQDAIREVYAYSTENAVLQAQSYFTEFNPVERSKKGYRVQPVIYNATAINTKDKEFMKFQVDFQESIFYQGNLQEQKNYRVDITCKQFKATKQSSQNNPLGFYITNFIVSEIKDGFVSK